MSARYYFTVTAGRSGQASLCDLLRRDVPGCYAAFEEPQIVPRLPRALGDLERHFRRRFVETHELLGRGDVLRCFDAGDEASLRKYAEARLRYVDGQIAKHSARIYVDVSKYFARGLHRGLAMLIPDMGLIRLVRDPILNMRSFLNRGKKFDLDNSMPDAQGNILRLESRTMAKGEFYLWAWCEMYLRFDSLVEEFGIAPAVEIRTEHLTDPGRMTAALDALGLPHGALTPTKAANTNFEQGYGRTVVEADDIALFARFMDRLPADMHRRLRYFDDYDASRHAA